MKSDTTSHQDDERDGRRFADLADDGEGAEDPRGAADDFGRESRDDESGGAGNTSSTRSPVADIAIELATLIQRWIGLTLEKGVLNLRANISDILALFGLCLLGGILILGGIAYLDLLLFRWLVAALDSANWALFTLALGHVAIGGLLIRAALMRMRGEDES